MSKAKNGSKLKLSLAYDEYTLAGGLENPEYFQGFSQPDDGAMYCGVGISPIEAIEEIHQQMAETPLHESSVADGDAFELDRKFKAWCDCYSGNPAKVEPGPLQWHFLFSMTGLRPFGG